MFEIFGEFINFRDSSTKNIYRNAEGVTFEEFYSILDRSFLRYYEFFQSTIEDIIRNIHYKKVEMV
ncbi:MAG: hypothetical protein Q8936_20520 [Bacillota bacterium]|nr:hypothetical protein [Bacillota bacterium]